MINIIGCLALSLFGCDDYVSPNPNDFKNGDDNVQLYVEQYDPIKDNGQYWHPDLNNRPTNYISCAFIANQNGNNAIGIADINQGLEAQLLAQSAAGIINRAVHQGKSNWGVWFRDEGNAESYKLAKQSLSDMGISELGVCVPWQLPTVYGEFKALISGYVLCDVANNPESAIVASVAAHVYNAIIVDKRDEHFYSQHYNMLYDASQKTTLDSWNEFKDKCNNDALVVMPVQTGQLRDFSIANNLFVVNLNRVYGSQSQGQNAQLLEEILAWLKPGSPVYGWEQGVGEDQFVGRVSQYGHIMIPYDWVYNTSFLSLDYKNRQESVLAKVTNPQFIDWDAPQTKFVSYYLSDGDNVQWMINRFKEDYFTHPQAVDQRISFGFPVANLAMISPSQFKNILSAQSAKNSIIENLGGGYYYVDNFGELSNRSALLESMAEKVANHMRQHRVKLLGLVAQDARSGQAKEAYQTYISANDQLEGIVVIQYSPYAGGEGEIMWFTNSKGFDIPVVCVDYSIWNFDHYNNPREGTPTFVANKINNDPGNKPFSFISVHAWSRFTDTGLSTDELAENAPGGTVYGPGAAELCSRKLGDHVKVVNAEELIWRIRKHYRPEQTQEYLSTYY